MYEEGRVQESKGFGIASLVLGILSLVLFCTCINIPMAIAAVIFGIIQLVCRKGSGTGLAVGGIITGVLSIIAFVAFWLLIGVNMAKLSDTPEMREYIEYMQETNPELFEDIEETYEYDDASGDDAL